MIKNNLDRQRTDSSQNNPEKKRTELEIHLNVKIYFKDKNIKTALYCQKDRFINIPISEVQKCATYIQ